MTARRHYAARPETAFAAWVDPDSIEKWFGPPGFNAKVLLHEPRVGGAWRFLMFNDQGDAFHHFGRYVAIDSPHRLAFTWASEEQVEGWRDENGDPTLVTIDFEATETGVMVTITHEQLASERAREALTYGWSSSLESLDGFLNATETVT